MTNPDIHAVDLAKAIKEMREKMPAMEEFAKLQARLARARYVALCEAGFTESQAMQLCSRELKFGD